MKKAFVLAIGLTGLCVSLFAAEEPSVVSNQYGYMNLGLGPAPFPIPQFGAGYRLQKGNNGFDANLLVSTVVKVTALQLGLDYLYYMNPDRQKEFYIGVGPAIVGLLHSDSYYYPGYAIAPEFIFGKQYVSDTGQIVIFRPI